MHFPTWRSLRPYDSLTISVCQWWHINLPDQWLSFSWFCNNCYFSLWLPLKDCHTLFTVCHTPLALWQKRFIRVSVSKLCPSWVHPGAHSAQQRTDVSVGNDLKNNLTYFTTDLCCQDAWMDLCFWNMHALEVIQSLLNAILCLLCLLDNFTNQKQKSLSSERQKQWKVKKKRKRKNYNRDNMMNWWLELWPEWKTWIHLQCWTGSLSMWR